jgi:hypothetical protein
MPAAGTIWRRRAVLMAAVGLVVAVPVTLLVSGDDDGSGEPAPPALPALNPTVVARESGISYRVPEGWEAGAVGGTITLSSGDETVQMAIAAPAPAARTGKVLDDALASIRDTYGAVEVNPGSGRRIGGLPARGAVASARNPAGTELRILVAAMRGRERAYLVEVFTAGAAPPERVAEAQSALNELRLTG